MDNFLKLRLGESNRLFESCFANNYIGVGYDMDQRTIDHSNNRLIDWSISCTHPLGAQCSLPVGQIQRYMGYIKDEVAEKDQNVKGVIIALEDDKRVRQALSVANDIELYRYEVGFKLRGTKK